jgi:hypothetical protein
MMLQSRLASSLVTPAPTTNRLSVSHSHILARLSIGRLTSNHRRLATTCTPPFVTVAPLALALSRARHFCWLYRAVHFNSSYRRSGLHSSSFAIVKLNNGRDACSSDTSLHGILSDFTALVRLHHERGRTKHTSRVLYMHYSLVLSLL